MLTKKSDRVYFEKQNPFQENQTEDAIAAVGYKYRQWKLAGYITIIARCQVDGIEQTGAGSQLLTIRAINEYQPTFDWKSKLDAQRGSIFMNELKNNLNKFTRWTAQALLSGSDKLKLGFISRAHFGNPNQHVILSVDKYAPLDFAKQIEMNIKNIWGIVRQVVDTLNKHPDGQFLLVKDPMKQALQLYGIPDGENIDDEMIVPDEDADVSDTEQ